MGVDHWITTLEEINKHDTHIITFTHGIRTNSDNNNKKKKKKRSAKRKREISFIHSIKPYYNKSLCSKK